MYNFGMDMAMNNFAISTVKDNILHVFVSTKYKTLSKLETYEADNICMFIIDNSNNMTQKIDSIINWIDQLNLDKKQFCIEGHSFGSVGNRSLQSAELIGALKYTLDKKYESNIVIANVSTLKAKSILPSIKKIKMDGKAKMYESIKEQWVKDCILNFIEFGKGLKPKLDLTIEKQPISDIVDSYHLSKFHEFI
jgi:hypothetical protein